MPEERDVSVLEDPAADEAWTYLQRHRELTPETLSVSAGLELSEAAAGLAALRDGGYARTEDDETYTIAEADAPAPRTPPPSENGGGDTAADVARAALPETPVDAGLAQLDPRILVAVAKGEAVKLRITGWVQLREGGVFETLNIEAVHDASMPGDGPVG